MNSDPWILGYSATHNGAVALLHGDTLVCAIQEERLTGEKRARIRNLSESLALRYCLQAAGISINQVDVICGAYFSGDQIGRSIAAGWPGRYLHISHHLAHAVGAFAQSGFDEAAILIVDGQGGLARSLPADERAVAVEAKVPGLTQLAEIVSIYRARDGKIVPVEKQLGEWIVNPQRLLSETAMQQFGSLGGMFASCAHKIFGDANEAGKVMGLAAYGERRYPTEAFFHIEDERFVFRRDVVTDFAQTKRWPAHRDTYQDLACSAQAALEDGLLWLLKRTAQLTGEKCLAYAGGVTLNCVANELLVQAGTFDDIFFMPAAEDSGTAVGAAYFGLQHLRRTPARVARIETDYCGRRYAISEIDSATTSVPFILEESFTDTQTAVVEALCEGKFCGWHQGGSELGPRALGHRSILADPRGTDTKQRLNEGVKFRESFRPFAPIILEGEVDDWFEKLPAGQEHSPFMLRNFSFRNDRRQQIPAVAHVDGTGRVQTLSRAANTKLYDLIERFAAATGVPILLNTSFNLMGEPIVETPEDALWCLLFSGLDLCVIGDRLFRSTASEEDLLSLIPRVTVHDIQLRFTVPGRLDLSRGPNVARAGASSQWGAFEQEITSLLPVLAALDNQAAGAALCRKLQMTPRDYLQTIYLLRRRRLIALEREPASRSR